MCAAKVLTREGDAQVGAGAQALQGYALRFWQRIQRFPRVPVHPQLSELYQQLLLARAIRATDSPQSEALSLVLLQHLACVQLHRQGITTQSCLLCLLPSLARLGGKVCNTALHLARVSSSAFMAS